MNTVNQTEERINWDVPQTYAISGHVFQGTGTCQTNTRKSSSGGWELPAPDVLAV